MSSTGAEGSEDVNDFLQRIKELGDKRDQEDEERNRKLEEEILQGRAERQARRAERARSISPTKSSPAVTPTSRTPVAKPVGLSDVASPIIKPRSSEAERDTAVDDAMDRLTGTSPTKEGSSPFEVSEPDTKRPLSIKAASPSSAMPPSRNSPLSWQRRPESQASDRPRSRKLSTVATENAARSPRPTLLPSEIVDEPTLSRDQIAQSLASKDPTWFKQTADRGLNSPAYRRNQVEDEDRSDHSSSASRGVQMPGMIARSDREEIIDRSSSPSRMSRSSATRSSFSASTGGSGGLGSPIPLTTAHRFEPPVMAMSPSQGRISPDRLDRPASPTKGMGGFVQSAMMKRSDSVNKRWSVQSPAGLSRGNSIASNRSSVDPSSLSALAREHSPKSPKPLSRPSSSHSNATITQDGRPGTSGSMKSSITTSTTNDNDGFVKPALPASRSHTSLTSKSSEDVTSEAAQPPRPETPLPSSPTKTMDPRRWSPTKSSWLESALNKPESPKPKATPPPQQQPAWMAEIAKAKQKGSVDLGRNPTVKHEVKVGGLMRSPPPGGASRPIGAGGLPGGFAPGFTHKPSSSMGSGLQPGSLNTMPSARPPRSGSIDSSSPIEGKAKPETPPKKDFRSVLKSRQLPTDTGGKNEPEFKNVFGQLKRTKTQNYVAPDELKNNITRGKMALNITGGPKKTERVDEFKEAILKKKEDFKKAQSEGKGVTRSASGSEIPAPLPEALVKKQALGRSDSISSIGAVENDTPTKKPATLQKETSSPGRLQTKEPAIGGKLAGRLNPALAGLLARGPPTASDSNRSSSPATSQRSASSSISGTNHETPEAGPQLTHMTKGRARGPRRKAPSTDPTANQSSETVSKSSTISSSPAKEIPTTSITAAPISIDTKLDKFEETPKPTNVTPISPSRAESNKPRSPSKVASLAEALSTPKSPIKEVERPASPSKVASIAEALKTSRPRSPTKTGTEIPVSQPSSPRKLDMKRRSQFLREAPSLDTKIEAQLGTPKPLSPTKKANASEAPVNFREPEQVIEPKPDPKSKGITSPKAEPETEIASPMSTPKPESKKKPLVSPKSTVKQDLPELATPKPKPDPPVKSPLLSPSSTEPTSVPSPSVVSPETAKKLTPAPLSPIKMKNIDQTTMASPTASLRSPSKGSEILPQTPKGAVDSESVVSVKNATALWGRSTTADTPSGPPRAKSPIKLPTKDETPESQGAIIRSPSPVREKSNGLVLQPVTKSSRPLPTPPIKSPMSPPPNVGIIPSSPTKTTDSSIPHTSEASQLLGNFFIDRKPPPAYKVDTAHVLTSRPEPGQLVQTIQSSLYQLSADGKKQLVPSHQERILFEGNMYLCIHNFENTAGKRLSEAYFWAGDDVPISTVDSAQTVAQKEAKAAGGKFIRVQQGKETPEFFQALGGILIIRRGSSNKYDSLAPHILCGRRFFGQIAFDEVDFAPSSLCSGFPYLVSAPSGKAYLWKGKGSGIDELSCARLLGMDFGLTGVVEEVEDGSEPADFLDIFGPATTIPKSADHWRLKPSYNKYCGRLFCAEASAKPSARSSIGSTLFRSSPEQIVEISPFNQADISPSNIYILDAFFEIYIIVGSRSQQQYAAFHNALLFASEYGILAASMEDRPFVPITNCVLEGVPKDLKSVFRKWTGGLQPTIQSPTTPLSRGRSLRVVPLTAALEAMKD